MIADRMDFFVAQPRNDVLSDRQANEAYLRCVPGRQYAVYFPDGRSVMLDLSGGQEPFRAQWLDIPNSRWGKEATLAGGPSVRLTAPGKGHWAVLVEAMAKP